MSYHNMIDELARHGRPQGHHDISYSYAFDSIEHEDFDIPGVLAVTPTGRVMLIVEGKKEHVLPIIEKAHQTVSVLEKPKKRKAKA